MKKILAVAGGVVIGLMVSFGVARAYSTHTEASTIIEAFGYVDMVNSPADVTTMTNTVAARTTAFPNAYAHVRLVCTENAYYKIGTSSVAAVIGDVYLPKNTVIVETLGPLSTSLYVSFIQDTATVAGRCQAKIMR